MELGTLDTTPVVRVDHQAARFTGLTRVVPALVARVYALHYGRKKFVKSDGKWSLDCVSVDCRYGQDTSGGSVACLSSQAHCTDCKSMLALAAIVHDSPAKSYRPAILELSGANATTVRDHFQPRVARGLPLDLAGVTLHLGKTASARMTFAQLDIAETDIQRKNEDSLPVLLEDFAAHVRKSFAMRLPTSSRPDLSSAELIV